MKPSEKGKELKKNFAATPDNICEPLTFGELQIGEKFIFFPDASSYKKGKPLKKACNVYKKTKMEIKTPYPEIVSMGRAMCLYIRNKRHLNIHNHALVIKLNA